MTIEPNSLDDNLELLSRHKQLWAQTEVGARVAILARIRDDVNLVAQDWAETAARKKGLAVNAPQAGEEWLSGPYALITYCNALMETLSKVAGNKHLDGLPMRELPNGQLAVQVVPHSIWDRLILSGVRAEVWMEPDVTRANLAQHTASGYTHPTRGKVALVLGAGNIAAIAPLDCLHKLFVNNEVVLLKMNPVNDYLAAFLIPALAALIEPGFLRIVSGDASVGQYLCNHPLVETIHITGSTASHDAIVWGTGNEATANKLAGTPRNKRPITSELGGVSPTIVVPGPWSQADIAFQAENVATQKLHNAGFNCIACQVLVLSAAWPQKTALLQALEATMTASAPRPLYYPGAKARLTEFQHGITGQTPAQLETSNQCCIFHFRAGANHIAETFEVFAPALAVTELPCPDEEAFLIDAIDYANQNLAGTLGANILIHPLTMRQIGQRRFDEIITNLRYGTISINAWTGLGFLLSRATWGAFPGHTLDNVQSGIGAVHNTMLFDRPQRTVVEAPFTPFPRNLPSLSFTLLPRPPWFITSRRAHVLGRLLTRFQAHPSLARLFAIFANALRG
ncbi:MAG: aldehyde dehydrogenase family protein [Terracidiphilus sp.]